MASIEPLLPEDDYTAPSIDSVINLGADTLVTRLQGAADLIRETLSDARILDDAELTEALQALQRVKNVADAYLVTMAHEVDQRTSGVPDSESLPFKFGCRSAVDYLQTVSNISRSEANARLRLAKAVGRQVTPTGHSSPAKLETVADAYTAGLLPTQSAQQIAQTLERSGSADAEEVRYAEKCLVEAATGKSYGSGNPVSLPNNPDSIRIMCRAWAEVLNRDGSEPNEARMFAKRGIRLQAHSDGTVRIAGTLTADAGALFGRLTDAINNPRARSDEGPQDERTAAQKRHDAFVSILQVAARAPETPQLGGAPVTVMIQVAADQLDRDSGNAWIQDHAGNPTPVSSAAAHHGACSGTIQFYKQNSNGRVVELSQPSRIFTPNQRRVITARDGGCVIPSCTVSSAWCEVHHVTPHAFGGKTHTDNGVLLCWYHHRSLDSSGWKIRMSGGVPQVKPPPWMGSGHGWITHRPLHQTKLRAESLRHFP